MKIELAKTEVIHFIGIGGIGMSGLSLIMKGMGFNVQGSDISHNKKCEEKHMLGDNPWMKSVLNKKNAKGYDKYLKHLVKNRTKTFMKKRK